MPIDPIAPATDRPALSDAAPGALRQFEDLPAPRGWPVVGNAFQLRAAEAHLQMEQWARELGPVFRLQMGKRRIVVVADHQLVAGILRDRPEGFGRTSRLAEIGREMGLPPGVFSSNGEAWKRQRRMVMAGFDPAHVRAYFPSLQTVASRLAGRWQRAAHSGQVIDLQADLMRYSVDTIAGLAFGAEVNTLESDGDVIQQHLDKIFPKLFGRNISPIPWWRLWRSPSDRQLERSVAAVLVAVQGFVREARERMAADPGLASQPGNLLEAMVAAADQPGSGIDDDQVMGNVLTMLLAGEDTTANTLAWMIHLLWQNPEALALATDEVRRICTQGAAPTLEQMGQLDFVEACAHETMRLKPVAPLLPTDVSRDVVLGDVQLRKGMVVVNLLRVDSVSPAHMPQPDAFLPQRWWGGEAQPHAAARMAQSAKRVSMPFGAGPRICPGRYLALLEMKMAMATLLGRFDIASVDTADGLAPRERLSFTMAPVGLRMRLRERSV